MVVFCGQVPTGLIGNDAFQEVDIVGITRPCTKHNYLVKDVARLAGVIKEAFYLARTGRPGPVLVDLPKDVIQARTEFKYPRQVRMRSYNPNLTPNAKQVARALEAIHKADRPLFYVGGGVVSSDAHKELTWLAKKLNVPVTATLMGLGSFPGDDPLWLGMLGMHGTYAANRAVQECDLLVAVGARFDDRVTGKLATFAPGAKVIHVDVDPTSIRKNVRVDVPIVADCRETLVALKAQVEAAGGPETLRRKRQQWTETIKAWKIDHPLTYNGADSGEIKPQAVVETIYELTKGEAIITTEVGQNQMWAAQFYNYHKPRTLLTSGGLGTMGYGFPAAIGAQVAFPDTLVIDVAGDGSIQMCIQEMATAMCYNLPVKIVILNNGYLGMVRQWQELFYKKNYCATCMDWAPDFVKLAQAYGAEGYRVTDPAQVRPVLAQAFGNGKPTIVDVVVSREENVYPMVPAGASLHEMLLV
jgi:acetolactate synthase-1/2/3 large subunit